jgi:hypothetical protein
MTELLRHPRRLGFVAFNSIALVLFALCWGLRSSALHDGVAGLPNLALGTTGMVTVAAVWAASWFAWGVMVWLRHRRRVVSHRHGTAE